MRAAFNDACGGYQRELGFITQLFKCQRAAVAHRGTDFVQAQVHIFFQAAGIRHIDLNLTIK